MVAKLLLNPFPLISVHQKTRFPPPPPPPPLPIKPNHPILHELQGMQRGEELALPDRDTRRRETASRHALASASRRASAAPRCSVERNMNTQMQNTLGMKVCRKGINQLDGVVEYCITKLPHVMENNSCYIMRRGNSF